MKKHTSFSFVLFIFIVCVLFPLMTILVWTIAGRWAWPYLIPQSFTLRGMQEIFFRKKELTAVFISSFFISTTVALLSVIIGILSARTFVLHSFRGKKLIYFCSALPLLVPTTVFGMGVHSVFIRWGISDTILGVIIAHLVYSLPYATFICTGAFEAIGSKYEEQARIFGAQSLMIFTRVTLPLIAPVVPPAFGIAYIISFSHYFLTLLLGGGSVKTFSIIMVPYLQNGDRTIAACYTVLFLSSTAILFIMGNILYRWKRPLSTVFYQ